MYELRDRLIQALKPYRVLSEGEVIFPKVTDKMIDGYKGLVEEGQTFRTTLWELRQACKEGRYR